MLSFTPIMSDRADNDVWGVLFETETPRLSAKALKLIGQGLRELYSSILEEAPGDRFDELIAALGGAEPCSKVSSTG
ncbi:hypothetical protein [Methylobacterium pseudosasicola]|uniref:hypothetical protein n=1 Tax=Methylobacterium pseudosasicola TaxID=582667 RepID=UPI000B8794AB|nr:hypothetical protein [Methylobacterium pseudosasicola]